MNEELSLLLIPGQLCDDNYIGELTGTLTTVRGVNLRRRNADYDQSDGT